MSFLRRERRSPNNSATTASVPDPAQAFESLWNNQRERNYQLYVVTLASLCIAVFALLAYARLAQSSRLVPFLYVVDRSGEVLAMGTAKPLPADTDTIVYQALAVFTTNIRAVYNNDLAQRQALNQAYVYLPADNGSSTSRRFVDAYLAQPENDPRLLAQTLERTADIVAITKLPGSGGQKGKPSTWRVRWRETTYPLTIGTPSVTTWEAFLAVRERPKTSLDAYDPNPFGIWIDSLRWNRLGESVPVK